jgi:hypothetical protein
MTTTRTAPSRLTTETITAENLSAGYRYMDATRTEYTVRSATMIDDANDVGGHLVVVVTTSGREITYKSWATLSVYVLNGRRDLA